MASSHRGSAGILEPPLEVEDAGGLPGSLIGEIIERAANCYERWEQLVAQTGYCSNPIRLVGKVERADATTGELRPVYSTEDEPDGTLLVACGNRRESACPSCAATYRADSFQLVAAGLRGGKGVPETVGAHPKVFVTFTAPSFGAVHTRRAQGHRVHPCRPRRGGKCAHGASRACWRLHDEDDPMLGEPLCPECFDYEGQVLWNALAPELWRRTTIYLRRALARAVGMSRSELGRAVRVSYVKVAEYQRRGALHFHAVIRLDGASSGETPGELAPPPAEFTAELLERALREAVAAVKGPVPVSSGEVVRYARWGEQLEVRHIRAGGVGELSAGAVAGYIAKYASKASEGIAGLDRRLSKEDLEALDVGPHLGRLVRSAWELGGREELRSLRLREWANALGFRGHFSTKSRRYSTTLTSLRRARVEYAKRRRRLGSDALPLDAGEAEDETEAARTVGRWAFTGMGYRTAGEVFLALQAAAQAREYRRLAKEEMYATTGAA